MLINFPSPDQFPFPGGTVHPKDIHFSGHSSAISGKALIFISVERVLAWSECKRIIVGDLVVGNILDGHVFIKIESKCKRIIVGDLVVGNILDGHIFIKIESVLA